MLPFNLVSSPPTGGPSSPPPSGSDDPPHGTGTLGMALFLATLSVLFAASLILYLLTRARFETWPPPGAPPLPGGLWLSTLLILASSATVHLALLAVRRGDAARLRLMMALTAALGVAFLVAQSLNWLALISAGAPMTARNAFAWMFYFLTGVHAAHVIGGLIAVAIVAVGAYRGRYTPANHGGVSHCAIYWHFLDVVWLVMIAVLTLT